MKRIIQRYITRTVTVTVSCSGERHDIKFSRGQLHLAGHPSTSGRKLSKLLEVRYPCLDILDEITEYSLWRTKNPTETVWPYIFVPYNETVPTELHNAVEVYLDEHLKHFQWLQDLKDRSQRVGLNIRDPSIMISDNPPTLVITQRWQGSPRVLASRKAHRWEINESNARVLAGPLGPDWDFIDPNPCWVCNYIPADSNTLESRIALLEEHRQSQAHQHAVLGAIYTVFEKDNLI